MDRHTPLEQYPWDQILGSFDGEKPTGDAFDLNSFSSPLYQIKALRDDAENAEKALQSWRVGEISDEDHQRDWKAPDWWKVVDPAVNLLANQSKDMRAAAWLGEGLVRLHGVAGLRRSLEVLMAMVENHWEQIHPAPDEEDGHTNATSAMKRLFGDLGITALGEVTFGRAEASRPGEPPRVITFDQYRFSSDFDKISDEATKQERKRRLGWVSTAEWREVSAQTSVDTIRSQLSDLKQIVELVYKLASALRERCQPTRYDESTSPDSELLKFRQRVEWMLDAVQKLAAERGAEEPAAVETFESDATGDATTVPTAIGSSQALAHAPNPVTREDAFKRIEEIAEFFEKQEPHSPVHFGLRQIVRWGRMSFPELLAELLEDESTMNSLSKRVGIPRNEAE